MADGRGRAHRAGGSLGTRPTGSLGMTEFLLHAGAEGHRLRAGGDRGARSGDTVRFFGINASAVRGAAQALPRGRARGGGTVRLAVRGEVRLRPLGPEGGVHARLPRDGRASSRRRASTSPATASGTRTSARASSSSTLEVTQPEGWHVISAGQRHLARRERARRAGSRTGRSTRSPGRRPARRLPRRRRARSRRSSTCARRTTRSPAKYLQATAQYVEMYRGLDRPLPVRQVRARRELLGDRLRHAVLHAARPAGHPLPVHPHAPPTRTRSSTTGGATRSSWTTRAGTGARA